MLLTFHLIALSWVFFRAKSVGDAWLILTRIGNGLAAMPGLIAHYPFSADHIIGAVLILCCWPSRSSMNGARSSRLAAAPAALRWAVWYLALAVLLVLGRWQAREFIYMQF